MDHSGQIHKILVEQSCHPIIIVPEPIVDNVKDVITSMFRLSTRNLKLRVHERYNIIGVIPDTELILNIKNHDWKIDIIRCHHSVPTDGFGFSELRKKLKDEYKGMEKEDIIRLKREGVELTELVEYPQFCYLGDTTHKVLENDILLKFPVIMIECTFLEYEYIREAKKKKHINWYNLEPYIREHPEIQFILYHFSARYNPYGSNLVDSFFSEYQDIDNINYLGNIYLWTKKNT